MAKWELKFEEYDNTVYGRGTTIANFVLTNRTLQDMLDIIERLKLSEINFVSLRRMGEDE